MRTSFHGQFVALYMYMGSHLSIGIDGLAFLFTLFHAVNQSGFQQYTAFIHIIQLYMSEQRTLIQIIELKLKSRFAFSFVVLYPYFFSRKTVSDIVMNK